MPNKALVRTQTTLRFVCAAQLNRYAQKSEIQINFIYLVLLLALTYVGIWVVYLFVATPETQTKYESVIELFIYAVNPENEGALFFQGTLLTIVLSAVLAWMVLKAKKLKMVIILGIINAVFALYMYQWHEIAIAVGAVVPLLIEAGNA